MRKREYSGKSIVTHKILVSQILGIVDNQGPPGGLAELNDLGQTPPNLEWVSLIECSTTV